MTVTVDSLFSPSTPDEAKTRILARLQGLGCPVTDWESGGIERTWIELEAQENSDFSYSQVPLAKSAFRSTAVGAWLDVLAQEFYGLTRYPAAFTKGVERFVCSGAAGPYTIVPGQLWIVDSVTGLRYTNTAGGVLASGGMLDLMLQAESPGAAYNATVGALTTMATPLAGVTCTNPDLDSDGVWATTPGTDQETNELLAQRCSDQWATLGYGQNADWFRYYCRNGHAYASQVTRVRVDTDPTGNATVNITIAGASGLLSGTIVTEVQNWIRAKVGSAITVNVASASALPVTIFGTAYVKAGYDGGYLAAAQAAMLALVQSLDIGGTLFDAAWIEVGMTPPGTVDFTVLPPTPAGDVVPAPTEVVTLTMFSASVVVV